MKPVNNGAPICPHTRYLEKLSSESVINAGDVIYSEWYGDNHDDLGDVRDPNRFRLGVVLPCSGEDRVCLAGNQYTGDKWFKSLSLFLRAMPNGTFSIHSIKDYDSFTSYWRVGHIDQVSKLFNTDFHVPNFTRFFVELKAHLEAVKEGVDRR
jgi:hypothetical protein